MKGLLLVLALFLLGSSTPPAQKLNIYEVKVRGKLGNCYTQRTYEVKAATTHQAKEVARYQMEYELLQITASTPRRVSK